MHLSVTQLPASDKNSAGLARFLKNETQRETHGSVALILSSVTFVRYLDIAHNDTAKRRCRHLVALSDAIGEFTTNLLSYDRPTGWPLSNSILWHFTCLCSQHSCWYFLRHITRSGVVLRTHTHSDSGTSGHFMWPSKVSVVGHTLTFFYFCKILFKLNKLSHSLLGTVLFQMVMRMMWDVPR